jgi:hypothetical protein
MIRWSLLLAAFCWATSASAESPKKLLLIGQGPDGHPPGTHEYVAGIDVLARCLKPVKGLELTVVRAEGPWKEGPELLDRSDGAVLFVSEGARWLDADTQRREAFRRLAARGGGLVALHWAIGTRDAKPIAGFLELLGGCHGGPDRKYKVLDADVQVADVDHPIAAGLRPFRIREEFYYRLKFVKSATPIRPVLRVKIDGEDETVAWSWERPDGGRSFGFSGLHFHENWRLPEYRRLVAQAALWAVKLPVPPSGLDVGAPP